MSDPEKTAGSATSFWSSIPLPYPALFTYKVDREIELKKRAGLWPGWIINIGILIFICGIIPVNVVTQGYETVSTYEIYHNSTLSHWFNKLWLKPAAGSECDPHIFSVGDTFVTNIGSFPWTLSAANSVFSGLQSGALNASKVITMGQYSGTSLDWCDVTTLHVAADTVQWKAEVSAVILCYNGDFILANTVVRAGWEDDAWFRERTTNVNMPSTWVQDPVQWAAMDLLNQMNNLVRTNASQATQLAITGLPTQCPQQYLKDKQGFLDTVSELLVSQRPWCTPEDLTAPPALGVEYTNVQAQVLPPGVVQVPVFDLVNAVNNTMQAMLAAVRWDLGNLLPNNILSNTAAVLTQNETFLPPLTVGATNAGGLFNYLYTNPWNTTDSFTDLQLPETPLFLVNFLCHLSTLKSPGSLFVSVLIGTLSISTSAWTLLLLVAAWLYKRSLEKDRRDYANYCQAHAELLVSPVVQAAINAAVEAAVQKALQSRGLQSDEKRPEIERGDTYKTSKSDSAGSSSADATAPFSKLEYQA